MLPGRRRERPLAFVAPDRSGHLLDRPYLPDGALIVSPDETRPLRSGQCYLATVSRRVAERAVGWVPPPEAKGFSSAVATVFTAQDHVAELDATGALLRTPMPERMRIVVLVPRGGSGFALVD